MIAVKFVVLLAAWLIAWVPGIVALAMWRASGGHLYGPEVATVSGGSRAARRARDRARASPRLPLTDGAASAAVLTLAVTLGTWALDFIGQVRGGTAMALARFTPDSVIRVFEHGELRLDLVLATLALVAVLLALAVVWLRPARSLSSRLGVTGVLIALAALGCVSAVRARASLDWSEDRRSSFAVADEMALRNDPRAAVRDGASRAGGSAARRPRAQCASQAPSNATVRARRLCGAERDRPVRGVGGALWRGVVSTRWTRGDDAIDDGAYRARDDLRACGRSATNGVNADAYPGYPHVARIRLITTLFYVLWPVAVIVVWWTARRHPEPSIRKRKRPEAADQADLS